MRYAVVNAGIVENVVELAVGADWQPPAGRVLIATDVAGPGDTWDGVTFIHRPPDNGSPPPRTLLEAIGLVRFTATAPIGVIENIGLGPVTRIVKGRYRATFNAPLATSSYSVILGYKDAIAVRNVRCTLRAVDFCEVRVIDTSGLAVDPEEITIKIERVVTQ